MIKNILYLFIYVLPFVGFSQADSIQVKEDLKVGLVLSGGGAKGFAHVGVLKVLEEAGIRIDYIGGTSMGAIIGALYASGYSANELDSLITSFDYDVLMQDIIPRRAKSIYQKENTEKYAIALPFKNRGLTLPLAVSKGQNVLNILSKLTEHVHTVKNFADLPVPFFCIATNLENGQMEVLDEGFLPEAVRASGSFPTLLDPVEIDGKLLTDGGVVNNFPVDIMRTKGVDIVIGVDVQDRLETQRALNTAPKILMQIVNFQMYDDVDLKRKDTDLYLHPDINDYTVVSFDLAEEIITKGEEVARKQFNYLLQLSKKQNRKKEIRLYRHNHNKQEELFINKIRVFGNRNYTKEYVLGKLKITEKDTINYKKLNDGINKLSATGNFRNVQYKFLENQNGLELQISLKEQEESSFLQLGIHYDDLYKTGVLVNYTSKHAIFKNDVFSADLILGDNIRYNIDYFIDNGFHWSYGIKTRYNRFDKSFFESSINEDILFEDAVGKIPLIYNDFSTQLFSQTEFGNDFALRIGLEHKYLRIFYETLINNKTENIYFDKTNYVGAFSNLILDTYDDMNFPKKGIFFYADFKTYLAASNFNEAFEPFSQLKGEIGGAFTIGNKFTTHIISEAGITIGNGNRIFDFFLGGYNYNYINNFIEFYGYDMADLSEKSFLKSAITFRYELFKNHYTSFIANAARVEDDILNEGAIFDNTKTGFALGYSIKSGIGPLEIKYAWSPDTNRNYWLFNVGFWF